MKREDSRWLISLRCFEDLEQQQFLGGGWFDGSFWDMDHLPKTTTTQATVWIFISILSCECLSSPIKKDLMPPKPEKDLPTKLATFIFPHLSHLCQKQATNLPDFSPRMATDVSYHQLLASLPPWKVALQLFQLMEVDVDFLSVTLVRWGWRNHTRNPLKKKRSCGNQGR